MSELPKGHSAKMSDDKIDLSITYKVIVTYDTTIY